jgi:hypothetical protein
MVKIISSLDGQSNQIAFPKFILYVDYEVMREFSQRIWTQIRFFSSGVTNGVLVEGLVEAEEIGELLLVLE